MISIPAGLLNELAIGFMLVSLRIFGLLLALPMFAFKAMTMQLRITLTILLTLVVIPGLGPEMKGLVLTAPTWIAAGTELMIGVFAGFVIRLGLLAIEVAAEVLSFQTGLSFATSFVRDPNIAAGLMGEFLGLVAIALMFVFNVHLLMLELLFTSFKVLPFGQWPMGWDFMALLGLVSLAFQLGLVLAMPSIVVYLLFYVIQAILARTSPQFNLFSVGFAITVPLAFLVLIIILPDLPQFVARVLESPLNLVRSGLTGR